MFLRKIFPHHPDFLTDPKIFDAGFTFLSNIIRTRILNINAKRGPLFVIWVGTYRCNANCQTCNTQELHGRYPENISLERAKEIAHEIGRAKTWLVGFTGGEILLWPHLFEVIKILKQYGVIVYINTNGFILKSKVQEIIDAKVDTVSVSMDSLDPKEHDENRRRPGLSEAIAAGINLLKEKRSGKKPLIKSTTVLSRKNYRNIDLLIAKLKKIVDVTTVQPVITGYVNSPNNIEENLMSDFLVTPEQETEVSEKIKNLIKLNPDLKGFYVENIPNYWFHRQELLKVKCWSPFLRLQIMPNGEVFHCGANPRYGSVGNLSTMSLMDVWNSPEIKRHREEIRNHQNKCVCWCQDVSFNALLHKAPLANKLPVLNKRSQK